MGKKLYVRNLNMDTDANDLETLFGSVGDVVSAVVSNEGAVGQLRRVGHIEMATEEAALDCIARFHGKKENGSVLIVTEDKPHVPNPSLLKPNLLKSKSHKSESKSKARA